MNRIFTVKDMNKKKLRYENEKKIKYDSSAADIDSSNYTVFLNRLGIERTIRMYKSLANLSEDAVYAVSKGMSKEFSDITDRMRPLMSYVADNNVKLSSFVDQSNPATSELLRLDPTMSDVAKKIQKNLKIIQTVRETMGSFDYNPVFLQSQELINAYIDFKLNLAWEFELDVIFILNL